MEPQPTLETDRLRLRPFQLGDAAAVQRLAGERDIAASTTNIPHPYEDGVAERWISTHPERFDRGESVVFAVTLRQGGELIGAIGLEINPEYARAELGYWIGKPYWNQGYCTEAARAVVDYGFRRLGLNRIHARHFQRNPASGRVMQKIGMRHEGSLRQHVRKWGVFEDIECYAVLRAEYES
ncbi:MAG: GNAT family N-acetyltransferase [Chloroflexota bacterium]